MKTPLLDALEASQQEITIMEGEDDYDPNEGDKFARCIVAIDNRGKAVVLEVLNHPTDWLEEFMGEVWDEYDWDKDPGLYQVDFGMSCTQDYFGEVDCDLTDSNWVELSYTYKPQEENYV